VTTVNAEARSGTEDRVLEWFSHGAVSFAHNWSATLHARQRVSALLHGNTDPTVGPIVKRPAKEVIAVVARSGQLLAVHAMLDAFVGSQDLAIGKARTAGAHRTPCDL
jgi:hypothetical protein